MSRQMMKSKMEVFVWNPHHAGSRFASLDKMAWGIAPNLIGASKKRWSSQWVSKGEVGKSRLLLARYKKQFHSLSLPQKKAAIGLMLGDASLQTQDGGKSHRLKLLQGDKNRDYLCITL